MIKNLKETVKTIWEALKSDVRTRLGIALSLTIFLLCRSYIETLPGGQQTFKAMAVPAFLICIIFWITIVLDIVSIISKRLSAIKSQKDFEKYMLNLSDEEAVIVKRLYSNPPQYKGYLQENDPNVLMLYAGGVITRLKHYSVLKEREVEDVNDPPILYILQPRTLDFIRENKGLFD